jgi:gentisate 1,2-dioxygenase
MSTKALNERDVAHIGTNRCDFRAQELRESADFRRLYEAAANVVSADEMPFENSPDGLIKHLVNAKMDTRECCVDAYMQFIPPNGATGRHRHMWEEVIFVAEGSGYDLHWDLKFDCNESYQWDWESEPRRFEWIRGDFIYIPPFSIHQHFSSTAEGDARLIVISNRIVKHMGFNWLDQLDCVPGYEPVSGGTSS